MRLGAGNPLSALVGWGCRITSRILIRQMGPNRESDMIERLKAAVALTNTLGGMHKYWNEERKGITSSLMSEVCTGPV